MQEILEMQVRSLGLEDPLEEGMATHSSILDWRTPWTEEPGGLPSDTLGPGVPKSDTTEATKQQQHLREQVSSFLIRRKPDHVRWQMCQLTVLRGALHRTHRHHSTLCTTPPVSYILMNQGNMTIKRGGQHSKEP